MSMPIPELPKRPVHLFTIKWWEMTWTGYTYYLTPCEATYHVFTPWRTFSPEGPAGLDLDHEWMISRNGRPECRMWGWASGLKDAMWEDRYLSKEEAAKAALKCAHVSQEVLENRLHDVRENIIELEKIANG